MADLESPTIERMKWLRDEFEPWAKKYFAANPKRQSLLLSVSQYWNDEADDAVHETVIASNRAIPSWPAPSPYDEEIELGPDDDLEVSMWDLEAEIGRLSWDDNSYSIRPFQALCGEMGSQELSTANQDYPILLAQRDGDGVRITEIGEVRRPWLDLPQTPPGEWMRDRDNPATPTLPAQHTLAPEDVKSLEAIAAAPLDLGARRVWADACLERHDARGEFMAQREPSWEQRVTRGEFFLGALNTVVPLSTARFEFGSLSEAVAYFDEQTIALADSPLWLSVHTLRLASHGPQRLTSSMRGVRHLSGLRAEHLGQLAGWAATPELLSLHVSIEDLAQLRELEQLPLHRLEALTLVRSKHAPSFVVPASWTALQRLTLLDHSSPTFDWDEEPAAQSYPSVRDVRAKVRFVSVALCGDGGLEEGWRVEFDREAPDRAKVFHERLGPASIPEVREGLLEGLPASVTTLELVPSRVWLAEPFERKGRTVVRGG